MFTVKNEFRILQKGKVIHDWKPQLVTNEGLFTYINPSLNFPSYKIAIGAGNDPATVFDTSLDNHIAFSGSKSSAKTEYKSAFGKAIAIFSFDLPVVTEKTFFNQIGMYVNNTLFSKLVYSGPIILLPGEGAEVQYRISIEAASEPTVTEEELFTYSTLACAWGGSSAWTAVPKGMRLHQAYLSYDEFDGRLDKPFVTGVAADAVTVHHTTYNSVTYLASWGITKGSGTYKSIWIRDSSGRAFQIGTSEDARIFKNNQNLFSCLITVNLERADGFTL